MGETTYKKYSPFESLLDKKNKVIKDLKENVEILSLDKIALLDSLEEAVFLVEGVLTGEYNVGTDTTVGWKRVLKRIKDRESENE